MASCGKTKSHLTDIQVIVVLITSRGIFRNKKMLTTVVTTKHSFILLWQDSALLGEIEKFSPLYFVY